jgi:site-specific DNA-methyltransferase (adenine-specific)
MAGQLRDRILGLETIRLSDIVGFRAGNPVARNDRDRGQLSASLRVNGYVQPIEVRRLTELEVAEHAARYECIDGHGRIERIQAEYPDTVEVKALILDVATAAEGRAILLGLRHQASWGLDELESWMRGALDDGLALDDALAMSLLTDDDLDALSVVEDLDTDNGASPTSSGSDVAGDGKEVEVAGHTRKIGGHKVRPPAQMTSNDWVMRLGDSAEKLLELPENSIDAMVTDPPAGIAFMGKAWDTDKGGRDQWSAWLARIMAAAMRAMKPGAHGLVWALPRTQHWTMRALEDAGFEIRDVVYHGFATGFPKSLNVSKAIDARLGAEREPDQYTGANHKNEVYGEGMGGGVTTTRAPAATPEAAEFDGYGTALKPAIEPWIVVRKPLEGMTVAECAMRWGTGGINIDGCRIGSEVRFNGPSGGSPDGDEVYALGMRGKGDGTIAEGRWPAHFVMTHAPECDDAACATGCPVAMLDAQSGVTKSSDSVRHNSAVTDQLAKGDERARDSFGHADSGGASRFFYCAKPSRAETEAGLDALEVHSAGELTDRNDGSKGLQSPRAGAGRGGGRRNTHPTKKPIELMRHFVRLVAPPKRGDVPPTILDPFAGSGTTGLAALVEGCRFLGIEMEPQYHRIASERLRTIVEDPRTVDTADEEPPTADEEPPTQAEADGSIPAG